MRTAAPQDFDISHFFRDIYTFQKWDLFPGITTGGPKDVVQMMSNLGVPSDLRGLRVLDIAPWNGFFSFECVRRGASEVISIGPENPDDTGFSKTRDLLEISNCTYLQGSVYDLNPAVHGKFDVVLFLGLIYHLRHPLLALDRIFDVALKDLYVDSPIIDHVIHDQTVSDRRKREILSAGKTTNELPLLYFTKASETGDFYNWFIPNRRALADLVESSGFDIRATGDDRGGWAWLKAEKAERKFTVGLEGYNPGAAKFANV